ncbi:HAD family hydrolase [Actinospica robiniae]|uniref:HAD family hydrolase n=1 Tax=Actinospica robiniae TaxID=304901 RepID=UPI000426DCCF|nr:HAD-IA family hydrolase [Actinospica robiniae]
MASPADALTGSDLGLGIDAHAFLFGLDGVLTRTAGLHAEAWKKTFDTFLRAFDTHSLRHDLPFDQRADFAEHLDGRQEDDGIRSFLASRGIEVPDGDPDDAPGTETIRGIAAAKRWVFVSLLEARGPGLDQGALRLLGAAADAGLPCAVVTSTEQGGRVLQTAGIADRFEVVVDGAVAAERGLPGKPAPDGHLYAARELGVEPSAAAVFEEALAGVEAARAGGFGAVVGVDRFGGQHGRRLWESGATAVVTDLADLLGPSGELREHDATG